MQGRKVTDNIQIEDVKSILVAAFKPHECRVEIYDYQSKIRYAVFIDGNIAYKFEKLLPEIFGNYSSLNVHISGTRKILSEKYTLDEWIMPIPTV